MLHATDADGDFLDLVYGAAIEPALWKGVLDRLRTILRGSEAHLAIQDESALKTTALYVGADPATGALYANHFIRCNPLLKTRDRPPSLRVMTDEQKLARREFVRTEFYNDFLRRFDSHSLLIARLALDMPSTTTITVIRPARREPFGAADLRIAARLQPHLIRAYRLSSRFCGMAAIDGTREALLELSAHAVFVLDAKGTIRYANRAAETLAARGDGLNTKNGSLRTNNSDATKKLQALIGAASAADEEKRSGGAMALARAGRHPLSLTVVPIRGGRVTLFGLCASVLVCVSDPEAEIAAPPVLLRALFGFTPAEARVALCLLNGCDLREAAARLGVSYYTVRGHLARMFDKTATSRQSELVALLTRSPWATSLGPGRITQVKAEATN